MPIVSRPDSSSASGPKEAAQSSPIPSSKGSLAARKDANGSSVRTLIRLLSMESRLCEKGSLAKSVIDLGMDRRRPSGSRTMTNFGPRADLIAISGRTSSKRAWRRETIRTWDTSSSTTGAFCADREPDSCRRDPGSSHSQRPSTAHYR